MKNNIIIKMEPFEISDSEIRGYMDFPAVLKDHQRARFPWKYLWEIIAILSVTGLLIFLNTNGKKTVSTTSDPIAQEQLHQEQANVPEKKMADSVQTPQQVATDADKMDSPPTEDNKDTPTSSEKMTEKTDNPILTPVEVPEQMVFIKAEPKDGMTALYDYFDEHLKYPATELGTGIEGKTLVTFTVFTDGSIGEIFFESSLGESFDQEAVRVLRQMPSWTPARVNDEPVDSKMSIPLYFEEQ